MSLSSSEVNLLNSSSKEPLIKFTTVKSSPTSPTMDDQRPPSSSGLLTPVIVVNCSCPPSCKCNNCQRCSSSNPRSSLLNNPHSPIGSSNSKYGSITSSSSLSPQHESLPFVNDDDVMITVGKASEMSLRCECHTVSKIDTNKAARCKLITACIIALLFMTGEVIGGYFSHSLAIMTDAAHMLSDFASFLISLFSIWMATRPPSKRMSFGWHRAEVVGAVISVLIIWLITGILVYEAIQRIIHYDEEINADIMLITACVGVFVNVFMCMVLHQHDHGHGHGHGHSHGHSHGHEHRQIQDDDDDEYHEVHWWQIWKKKKRPAGKLVKEGQEDQSERKKKHRKKHKNINVRAAFIHVIGDLIQSIGVVIAGYIIKFFPEWHIVDPICTFLFSILVIISTLNVLRDAMLVLMEGAPRNIDTEAVEKDLKNLPNVLHAHSIHIWSLTMSKTALAAHLAVGPGVDTQKVLCDSARLLKEKYGFSHTTLQVEQYQQEMDNCTTCQGPSKKSNRVSTLLNQKKKENSESSSDNCA